MTLCGVGGYDQLCCPASPKLLLGLDLGLGCDIIERKLRASAAANSSMQFFNINLKGLDGRPHPTLFHINSPRDALRARSHMKFLCGDVYTFEKKDKYQGGGSTCRLCSNQEVENTIHIVSTCLAYSELRSRIIIEMKTVCESAIPVFNLDELLQTEVMKTQFLLDCTSMNLPIRINADSDLWFGITTELKS